MSNNPTRIQRKRTKGWRMPPDTVYVGRGGAWGNPYRIGKVGLDLRYLAPEIREEALTSSANLHPYGRGDAIQAFQYSLERGQLSYTEVDIRRELRGKNLACWCKPGDMCHADLLLEIANEDEN